MTGKEGDYRKGMKVNKGDRKRRISITGVLALLCLLTGMLSGCGFIEWLLEDEEDFYEGEQETEDSGSTVSLSERGTVISQEDGKLVIDRRSRDQEIPMGEDGWTIFAEVILNLTEGLPVMILRKHWLHIRHSRSG